MDRISVYEVNPRSSERFRNLLVSVHNAGCIATCSLCIDDDSTGRIMRSRRGWMS